MNCAGSGRRQLRVNLSLLTSQAGTPMALRLILGFDYGTKQIGVAVGQVITGQARELCTLQGPERHTGTGIRSSPDQGTEARRGGGRPAPNMDGTPATCACAPKFARRLNGRYNIPFYTHD